MSNLDRDSQLVLQCPTKEHWVSFRLLDEHGEGSTFAGLSFTIEDTESTI